MDFSIMEHTYKCQLKSVRAVLCLTSFTQHSILAYVILIYDVCLHVCSHFCVSHTHMHRHACTHSGKPMEVRRQPSGVRSQSFLFFFPLSVTSTFLFFLFVIDTISSLILWEFHIMYPIILFPVFPCLLPHYLPPQEIKIIIKKEKIQVKFMLFIY